MKLASKTLTVVSSIALAAALGSSLAGCSLLFHKSSSSSSTGAASAASSGGDASPAAQAEDPAQKAALDKLVALVQKSIPTIKSASPGPYSDVAVTGKYPGELVYTYTYAKHVDASAASGVFDAQSSTLSSAADSAVFPAMKAGGLTGTLTVTYTFLNDDGSVIWTKSYTSD